MSAPWPLLGFWNYGCLLQSDPSKIMGADSNNVPKKYGCQIDFFSKCRTPMNPWLTRVLIVCFENWFGYQSMWKQFVVKSASVASHGGRNIGNKKIEIHEQALPSWLTSESNFRRFNFDFIFAIDIDRLLLR